MKPDVAKVLMTVAGAIGAQLAPEVRTPHAVQTASLSAGLVALVAQEFDRAAHRLVEENEAVAALLRDARSLPIGPGIERDIAAVLESPLPADFRVSTLQTRNDQLRGALVSLHAEIEAMPGDAAAAFTEQIWDELKESTRRRHFMSPS